MKRIFAVLLALLMFLTACSSGDGNVESETSSGVVGEIVSDVEEGASEIIDDIMPDTSSDVVSEDPDASSTQSSETQENNGLPSASSNEQITPDAGSDTSFTQTGNVYKMISGTNAYFVIAQDFSSTEEGKARDEAIENAVTKAISTEYKEGYYCVAAVVAPESENSFDVTKQRSDFTVQIFKRQTPKATETGMGESIKKEVTLKDQSLQEYLETQSK